MYILLMMILFGGILLFLVSYNRIIFLGVNPYVFIIVSVVIFAGFYIRGRQIFEYDSEGEVLHFRNRDVIPLFKSELNDEFPKYKLQDYTLVNAVVLKKLYVTLTRKTGHPLILKYDVSYLSKKEIIELKISLRRIVKANKKTNRETVA